MAARSPGCLSRIPQIQPFATSRCAICYWSDVLETLAVLVTLGYGGAARLAEAYHWLLSKQDAQGRWKLQNSLNGKMWIDIEKRGKPSKWITLRALRVVKTIEQARSKAD